MAFFTTASSTNRIQTHGKRFDFKYGGLNRYRRVITIETNRYVFIAMANESAVSTALGADTTAVSVTSDARGDGGCDITQVLEVPGAWAAAPDTGP